MTLTLPRGSSRLVVPMWIMSVGTVAAFAPVPGVAAGVFLLLASIIIVPVVITGFLIRRVRARAV